MRPMSRESRLRQWPGSERRFQLWGESRVPWRGEAQPQELAHWFLGEAGRSTCSGWQCYE